MDQKVRIYTATLCNVMAEIQSMLFGFRFLTLRDAVLSLSYGKQSCTQYWTVHTVDRLASSCVESMVGWCWNCSCVYHSLVPECFY